MAKSNSVIDGANETMRLKGALPGLPIHVGFCRAGAWVLSTSDKIRAIMLVAGVNDVAGEVEDELQYFNPTKIHQEGSKVSAKFQKFQDTQ